MIYADTLSLEKLGLPQAAIEVLYEAECGTTGVCGIE
jgi:hypothetical protein